MLGLQVLVVCVSPVCDPAACFPRDFGSSCQYINRLESENCPNEYLNGNSFASCWSVEIPVAAVTLVELEMFALRVFSGRRNYRSRCGLLLVLSRQFWFDMMVLAIVLASVLLLPPLLLLIVLSSFQSFTGYCFRLLVQARAGMLGVQIRVPAPLRIWWIRELANLVSLVYAKTCLTVFALLLIPAAIS